MLRGISSQTEMFQEMLRYSFLIKQTFSKKDLFSSNGVMECTSLRRKNDYIKKKTSLTRKYINWLKWFLCFWLTEKLQIFRQNLNAFKYVVFRVQRMSFILWISLSVENTITINPSQIGAPIFWMTLGKQKMLFEFLEDTSTVSHPQENFKYFQD